MNDWTLVSYEEMGEEPISVHGYGLPKGKVHTTPNCGQIPNKDRPLPDLGIIEVPGDQICAVCRMHRTLAANARGHHKR